MSSSLQALPPDQSQRDNALDPNRSILVQAPAGSGKTTLLAQRFLTLLAEVEDPSQVVAITFTIPAAAEMRNRILDELAKTEPTPLAQRVLDRSQALGWKLLDLPAQLRISTIDAFCREVALQKPLLSDFGGGLEIAAQPKELYRQAARKTLEQIDRSGQQVSTAIELLLLWRDNNWQEMEELLVAMLAQRDRWMQDFVLNGEQDWELLRERLERPFAQVIHQSLLALDRHFAALPEALKELLRLARFACAQSGGELHRELAELAEFPAPPFDNAETLEAGHHAYKYLANMLLTEAGSFRKQVNVRNGFPADKKREKAQFLEQIAALKAVSGLESALASVRELPPVRYTEEEWQIVRACFTLLRHAAGELRLVFAKAGAVDFIEVAQTAQRVLEGADGLPTDAALVIGDGIRHLLVDEFQDTSRRQHRLLASIVAAWPERTGRTCFVVGDPMQSIYFFRDADAELFPRVKNLGLELAHDEPLLFDSVSLTANFRTARSLLCQLNEVLERVFCEDDGSGVSFTAAEPARSKPLIVEPIFQLHLAFVLRTGAGRLADPDLLREKEATRTAQLTEIIELIQSYQPQIEAARSSGEKFRVAVLGRARSALIPIAEALREAKIPFRAVDLEKLATRTEVLDALALARALLQPEDRVAWLGILRAPWCGLSLEDLHRLSSADDAALLLQPIPALLRERLSFLSDEGQKRGARVLAAANFAQRLRSLEPATSLGSWLQQAWLRLGGAACVDATASTNLDLLWRALDRLPGGEEGVLGPALDAALENLTALPDPASSSEAGVQLMTIHKSKGLEFEVVLVPELQASGGYSRAKMLAWLERGLKQGIEQEADNSNAITEFLVAPLQPKGEDRGSAKEWVDRVYRERESQEMRRILYVAATRAREQLHFFARPDYKEADGTLSLVEPANSLLATAWPALETEVQERFEDWKNAREAQHPEEYLVESIAASGESNLLQMPPAEPKIADKPTVLRCLPAEYSLESLPSPRITPAASSEIAALALYPRHEGGLPSRLLGIALHSLLEELARLRLTKDWPSACLALQHSKSRIVADLRSHGLEPREAATIAAEAHAIALHAADDPVCQWILSPHPAAESEVRWAGIMRGKVRTVQVDRIFRAGATPRSTGEDHWWIIDYKTHHDSNFDQNPAAGMSQLRPLFAPQLEAYAEVLGNLRGTALPICVGIYYPQWTALDWWEI